MILRRLLVTLVLVKASFCQASYPCLDRSDPDYVRVQVTLGDLANALSNLKDLKDAHVEGSVDSFRQHLSRVGEIYASLFNNSVNSIPLLYSSINPSLPLRYLGTHSSYVMSTLKGSAYLSVDAEWINQERSRGPIDGDVKAFKVQRIDGQSPIRGLDRLSYDTLTHSYLLTLNLGSYTRRTEAEVIYTGFLNADLPLDQYGMPYFDLVGPEGRRLSLKLPVNFPFVVEEVVKSLQEKFFILGRRFGSACELNLAGIPSIYVMSRFREGTYGLQYDVEQDDFGIGYGIFTFSSLERTYKEVFELQRLDCKGVLCSFGLRINFSNDFNRYKALPLMWFSLDKGNGQSAFHTWQHTDWAAIEQGSNLNIGETCLSKLLKCLDPSDVNLPRFYVELAQTSRIVTELLTNRRKLKISVCVDSSTEVSQPPPQIRSFEYLSSPGGQNSVDEDIKSQLTALQFHLNEAGSGSSIQRLVSQSGELL